MSDGANRALPSFAREQEVLPKTLIDSLSTTADFSSAKNEVTKLHFNFENRLLVHFLPALVAALLVECSRQIRLNFWCSKPSAARAQNLVAAFFLIAFIAELCVQ